MRWEQTYYIRGDTMEEQELYAEYGKLMVQAEVLNAKINETKKQISDMLRKPLVGQTND